jgi:glyoxylase-like metal-dependent hydrolase (beta-lactamase superfamily II)
MAVRILDTRHLGRPGIIAVTALETRDGLALFDVGPESTFENVLGELRTRGFAAMDVRDVFLSHIHFDHAGAAWRFAGLGATIHVHPRGAPHLIDPTKLIESATRLYGDQMGRLWGRLDAVPAEKVKVANDNDIIQAGEFEVRAVATPGHAGHHNVYQWEDNVFGGDVAGVRLKGGPVVPPFVPPELQIESWRDSIAKIRRLNPARLYLPHFGVVEGEVPAHLDALEERVNRWAEWFRDEIRAGRSEEELISSFARYEEEDLRKGGAAEEDLVSYECADPSFMAVSAAERYWRKYHPEAVELMSGNG